MTGTAEPDAPTALNRTRFSYLTHLECSRCTSNADACALQNRCRCGGPLLARYDLDQLRHDIDLRTAWASRPPSLWKYHELLPLRDPNSMVTLGEGWTPLLDLPRLADVFGVDKLWLKDDSLLPTGTFKARGAAVGVSCAVERNVRGVALPTNGNAGAAWAAYAARAGISVRVVMPGDAPAITRAECTIVGADLSIVDGDISDAAAIVRGFREADWYDVATLNEPYRLEGKKTMTLELVEQLGWRVPDVVVYPTGGGIGLIALYKALSELIELELIENRLPRVVAVQAAGCAPIVRAFEAGTTVAEPWENARTVAFGITVPKPLGDFMILEALRATRGCATAVSDAELLRAQEMCGHEEGVFVCPEGAAAIAAVHQLRARGWIMPSEEVIVVNTGTGLKYPHTVVANARTVERRPTPAGFDR